MLKSSDQVISLIRTGQNVIIPSTYLTGEIIRMCSHLTPGQHLTIRNAGIIPQDDLIQIAESGILAQITFDFAG